MAACRRGLPSLQCVACSSSIESCSSERLAFSTALRAAIAVSEMLFSGKVMRRAFGVLCRTVRSPSVVWHSRCCSATRHAMAKVWQWAFSAALQAAMAAAGETSLLESEVQTRLALSAALRAGLVRCDISCGYCDERQAEVDQRH